MVRRIPFALVALLPGCGGEDTVPPLTGEHTPDAGGCGPGTITLDDGTCQPAGTPPGGCAAGFSPADVGCIPILPPGPCTEGTMAVPGETRCREIMPCGAGDFGDLELEPDTQHVRTGASVTGADGSAANPWPTIQQGLSAAGDGHIVAVAAGTYAEDLVIDKPVRLWGKCPSEVIVRGSSAPEGAIVIENAAGGTELRGLSVRGNSRGVVVLGPDVVLDRLWVRDTLSQGVAAQNGFGSASFTLRGSLVDGVTDVGVFALGAEVTVEASVVRGTRPTVSGEYGRGIDVEYLPATSTRGRVTVRGSLVEQCREFGIFVSGADAVVEATAVRDIQPAQASDKFGIGVNLKPADGTAERSSLQMTGATIERCVEDGILVASSDATVETASVRDVVQNAAGKLGRGVELAGDPERGRSSLTLRWSLIERAVEIALLSAASDAVIEGTVIRDVTPGPTPLAGRGVTAQPLQGTNSFSSLTMRGSVVERTSDVGVYLIGGTGTVEGVLVRDTKPASDGSYGDGISVLGLDVSMKISECRIENSARAGISSFGGRVELEDSTLECNGIHLAGENLPVPFSFTDIGGNTCGCAGVEASCQAATSGLEPPEAIPTE